MRVGLLQVNRHLLPAYDIDSTVRGPGDHLHPKPRRIPAMGGVVDVSRVLLFALYPAAPRGLCARCARPCRYSRTPDTLTGVTIDPDAKDWTWVLHRTCRECGFDTRSFPRAAVPYLIRDNVAAWSAVLVRPGDLRRRPRPDVWSPP